jgi:hypothetical protein
LFHTHLNKTHGLPFPDSSEYVFVITITTITIVTVAVSANTDFAGATNSAVRSQLVDQIKRALPALQPALVHARFDVIGAEQQALHRRRQLSLIPLIIPLIIITANALAFFLAYTTAFSVLAVIKLSVMASQSAYFVVVVVIGVATFVADHDLHAHIIQLAPRNAHFGAIRAAEACRMVRQLRG